MRYAHRDDGWRWLWITLLVVIADQSSKFLASAYLELHDPVSLLPSLNFTLAHNTGAAFSFLSSASGWQRWFFVVLALVVSVMIMVWMKRLQGQEKLSGIALALILGGALGNVWDRIQLGYVVDFIDFYYQSWHFPVFNLADSAITLGAILLIIDTFLASRGQREND